MAGRYKGRRFRAMSNNNDVSCGRAVSYNWDMVKKVIFVCSANYYRSRYAEHYFNWLASREQLGWKADSRGLMVGNWGNIGNISQHTLDALQWRGIPLVDETREPKPLTIADLAQADLVVAVKEAEHRALMAEQFPFWTDLIEYWQVDDLDCADAAEALPHLEERIHGLLERLRSGDAKNGAGCRAKAGSYTRARQAR